MISASELGETMNRKVHYIDCSKMSATEVESLLDVITGRPAGSTTAYRKMVDILFWLVAFFVVVPNLYVLYALLK